MRPLLLILACACFAFGECRNAYSQSPGKGADVDRDFQRWLPIPEGGQADIASQVLQLESLRSQFAPRSDSAIPSPLSAPSPAGPPTPELTEDQLRVLDEAYKAWTAQSGGQRLPDWKSLPKEWADKALANPEQLKQAQGLIEQYARQRNLSLPISRSGSRSAKPQHPATPNRSSGNQLSLPSSNSQASTLRGSATESRHAPDSRRPRRSSAADSQPRKNDLQAADRQVANIPSAEAAKQGLPDNADAPAARKPSGSEAGSSAADALKPQNQDAAFGPSNNGSSLPSGRQRLGAAGAPKQNMAEATRQETARQPAGQSDAAHLKALQEFLEKLKPIQASLDSQAEAQAGARRATQAADGPGSDLARNSGSAGKPASDREAAGKPKNRETSFPSRTPRSSAVPLKNSAPRADGGSGQPSRAAVPPQIANDPRPAASDQTSDSRKTSDQPGQESTASDDPAAAGGNFGLPGPPAGGSDDGGTFRIPPSAEQALSASNPFEPAQNDADAARADFDQAGPFREGSFDAGSPMSGSMPRLNSAARKFEISRTGAERNSDRSSGRSGAEVHARLRQDIERLGWQKALLRIIETTFRGETKVEPPARAPANGSPVASGSSEKWPQAKSQPMITGWAMPQWLSAKATAVGRKLPAALSNSHFAGVFTDVWKAIATAPPTESVASSTPPAPPAPPSDWGKWKWPDLWDQSGYRLPIALLLVAMVCVAVWAGRKRPAFLRTQRVMDTRWAKEALAAGIHTRADVIRAFHRFVSQTTEPVAAWWTHRYAARRLIQSTPQLAAAVSVLSSTYEQARYMPPEAELSAEQIERVCGALRECAAYGRSLAEAPT